MTGLARHRTLIAVGVFVVIAAIYPLVFNNSYTLGVGISAGAMAAGTVGFVLLIGYAHQLAVGQAAFCMIGGYANAILCSRYHVDPFVALIAGSVLSMVFAYIIAAPMLRLRGFVLAMGSLAFQLMLIVLALESTFTGGALGVYGIPKFAIFGFTLPNDTVFFYVIWATTLAVIAIGLNIDRSRIGRALKAIASSEMAAGSVGIDITTYKVQMFVISAGMASLTGSFAVHYLRAMDPNVFGFLYSLNLIIAVIVGGLLSIWGGALGAAIVTGLRELLRDLSLPLWEAVIMGAITVIVLLAFRRGFAGLIGDLFQRFTGTRAETHIESVRPEPAALRPLPEWTEAGVPILEVDGATCAFGSLIAVNNVSFTANAGEITALIGPNGAGKTTLFNLIGGYQALDDGKVSFVGERIEKLMPNKIALHGIGRTFQNLQLFDTLTVAENVMCGRHRLTRTGILGISARLPCRLRYQHLPLVVNFAWYSEQS